MVHFFPNFNNLSWLFLNGHCWKFEIYTLNLNSLGGSKYRTTVEYPIGICLVEWSWIHTKCNQHHPTSKIITWLVRSTGNGRMTKKFAATQKQMIGLRNEGSISFLQTKISTVLVPNFFQNHALSLLLWKKNIHLYSITCALQLLFILYHKL